MQTAPLPVSFSMEDALANSYRDFHTKGFDYICFKRTPTETLKLYFFDGDITKLPEVINPHDHRYPFRSWVVTGSSQNVWYDEGLGKTFNRFRWMTPLNGGKGFTWDKEVQLRERGRVTYNAGDQYFMTHDQIHTIKMLENETVLFLVQHEDTLGLQDPTKTFCLGDAPPSVDGLYRKWNPDDMLTTLGRLGLKIGRGFAVNT